MANLANLIVRGLSRLGNVIASEITATTFIGNLTGNASTATNATNDANGDPIASTYLKASQKGVNSGVAELDANGKVPSSQLPSYVDDVLEYASESAFPATGETGKIYVDTGTNTTYRWSGSAYVAIGSSLALGETSSTAYRGDRGAAAYTHAVTNKGSAFSSGLYKITTNSEGHVTAATSVAKGDITALGIPAQDTTYTAATTAPGDIASTGAVGASTNYAREDHTHGISLASGDNNGQVKIAGSNVSVKGLGSAAYTASTDYAINHHGVHQVIGTQTATTASWTGNIDVDALYDGLMIAYYLPRTSAANATLNLTLADGETTTGAIPVFSNAAQVGTKYPAGTTIMLTYWSAGSISINGTATTSAQWQNADYYVNNTNTIGEYGGTCIAGPNGMPRYSLIMQVSEEQWEGMVLTSGTGTAKTKNTSGFLINSPILYQNAATYAEGSTAGQSGVWCNISFDTRYSTNGGQFATAGNAFYLVGTITGDKFYLASTWWAKDLPTTENGLYYIYIGQFYSKYQVTLQEYHPIFYYEDGEIKRYFPAVVDDSKKLNGKSVSWGSSTTTFLRNDGNWATPTGDISLDYTYDDTTETLSLPY